MDTIEGYRQSIRKVLMPLAQIRFSSPGVANEAIFDQERDRYMIVTTGWEGNTKRIYFPFIHLDIINGKVWVQRDGTEDGIADELEAAGIPKSDIVLAFHPEKDRALIPEYAVA
jgi:hypothetical protein